MDDPLIATLLTGVANDRAEREQQRREALPLSAPLTFNLALRLREQHRADDPRECMLYAAIMLGASAGLRISEFTSAPKTPGRELRGRDLHWFNADGTPIPDVLAPGAAPARIEIHMRVSKTDHRRQGRNGYVSAPSAVAAIAAWVRLARITADIPVFAWQGKQLTSNALIGHTRRALERIGVSDKFTGKMFRRGMASTHATLGTAAADIARAGWAPSSRMWERYANHPDVLRERAFLVGAQLEPASRQ